MIPKNWWKKPQTEKKWRVMEPKEDNINEMLKKLNHERNLRKQKDVFAIWVRRCEWIEERQTKIVRSKKWKDTWRIKNLLEGGVRFRFSRLQSFGGIIISATCIVFIFYFVHSTGTQLLSALTEKILIDSWGRF